MESGRGDKDIELRREFNLMLREHRHGAHHVLGGGGIPPDWCIHIPFHREIMDSTTVYEEVQDFYNIHLPKWIEYILESMPYSYLTTTKEKGQDVWKFNKRINVCDPLSHLRRLQVRAMCSTKAVEWQEWMKQSYLIPPSAKLDQASLQTMQHPIHSGTLNEYETKEVRCYLKGLYTVELAKLWLAHGPESDNFVPGLGLGCIQFIKYNPNPKKYKDEFAYIAKLNGTEEGSCFGGDPTTRFGDPTEPSGASVASAATEPGPEVEVATKEDVTEYVGKYETDLASFLNSYTYTEEGATLLVPIICIEKNNTTNQDQKSLFGHRFGLSEWKTSLGDKWHKNQYFYGLNHKNILGLWSRTSRPEVGTLPLQLSLLSQMYVNNTDLSNKSVQRSSALKRARQIQLKRAQKRAQNAQKAALQKAQEAQKAARDKIQGMTKQLFKNKDTDKGDDDDEINEEEGHDNSEMGLMRRSSQSIRTWMRNIPANLKAIPDTVKSKMKEQGWVQDTKTERVCNASKDNKITVAKFVGAPLVLVGLPNIPKMIVGIMNLNETVKIRKLLQKTYGVVLPGMAEFLDKTSDEANNAMRVCGMWDYGSKHGPIESELIKMQGHKNHVIKVRYNFEVQQLQLVLKSEEGEAAADTRRHECVEQQIAMCLWMLGKVQDAQPVEYVAGTGLLRSMVAKHTRIALARPGTRGKYIAVG